MLGGCVGLVNLMPVSSSSRHGERLDTPRFRDVKKVVVAR